jgi:hypothetical protein
VRYVSLFITVGLPLLLPDMLAVNDTWARRMSISSRYGDILERQDYQIRNDWVNPAVFLLNCGMVCRAMPSPSPLTIMFVLAWGNNMEVICPVGKLM